ncbi:MAG: phosphonate metabolism transcriptional regulator PhnF [Roseitalea porphyridii]|uniref:phosphonate metabolism transcriptional regulator PhnF n=1 Tax=Roseitalea porphyridii TaxID=1852022 RepID=UPI0032D8D55D
MTADTATIERQSGIAVWRQIADAIRAELTGPLVDTDGKLPPETALAARFGVNRHTVRAAIRALVQEGAVRSERGRGTFVTRRARLTYPIGARTRFSAGLQGQATDRGLSLLSAATEPAGKAVAEALGLRAGAPLIRLETVGYADGVPVSRATSWFDGTRFADIGAQVERTGSVTRALALAGVDDYVRRTTTIEARHGNAEELDHLRLSPGAIVLVACALNVDLDGRPVHYAISRFAADRVTMRIGDDPAV